MNHVEVIVPVAFFGMIFGIVVLVSYYRNKRMERTALIASGKDASIFKEEDKKSWINSLKYGIFLVGIAIGFIVGDALAVRDVMSEGIAYIAMVLLFGGLALLVFYLLARKNKNISGSGE
jgi:predicted MFS family arabinose efflux permease